MKALTLNEMLEELQSLPENKHVVVVWEYEDNICSEMVCVNDGDIFTYNGSSGLFEFMSGEFDVNLYYIINNVAELGGALDELTRYSGKE